LIFSSLAAPPPAVQDVDLAQKLETELPGILNWALDQLQKLIKRKKFCPAPQATPACEKFKADLDPKELFLALTQIQPGASPLKAQTVRDAYERFYLDEFGNRNKIIGRNKFYHWLRQKGFRIENALSKITPFAFF
jgi:phage/plasmid-associated DNA primase